MSRGNEKILKDAIEEMLAAYKLKGKLNEVKVISSWEKIMGKAIANRTTDIYISGRKLFVKLSSAVLREELSFAREKMLKMLNDEAGEKVLDEIVLL
jgi:hypothetical protein